MKKEILKSTRRERRHLHVRKKVAGTAARPRLVVSRSIRNISVQIVNDDDGHTLLAFSSVEKGGGDGTGGNVKGAAKVGAKIAELAAGAGIKEVCFDRGGYRYHGRIKALAEAARKGGLKF